MKHLLKIYKLTLAYPLRFLFGGGGCRFSPTCSEYTILMIEKYGIIKGSVLGIKRVASCNSFSNV